MKNPFSLSFQQKVFLALLLLVNIPIFLTGYMAKNLLEESLLEEKEDKLMALAHVLNMRLGPDGYEGILIEEGAVGGTREEKIAAINRRLAFVTDMVGRSSQGVGVGYYSRDLDAILTYGPSESFGHTVGVSITPDHPGRTVMATGRPMATFGTMVRGDILNAMMPVERHGEVIGYIWANELATDISGQFEAMARNISLVMLLCFLLSLALLLVLSRRTVRAVDQIISGVRVMRGDLSARIAIPKGELGEVAASINAMAEDIGKATEESERAVSVLESVLNNLDAAVYVCDPQTKALIYCNEYLLQLHGRGDLQGRLCHQALYGSDTPCSFCPHTELLDREGKPAAPVLRWETHNDPMGRDFLITDRLVTWHDGRLLHMEVATDVTDRKALALAEAANLAQRDFLARMSHEIRTPMNGVLGMAHLAMQANPPPAQREYLKKIQASATLLLGIINDILDFSRIEAGKMDIERHVFSVREMVDNIRELILPRVDEKCLALRVELASSVPEYARGDALRLSQVLLNLLGNAAKFTSEGFITLAMTATHVSGKPGALRLDCAVGDTGIGMSPEQLAGLFKPFSQADSSTSRKFGGTGLGLSISKALVELMDGGIKAASEESRGSVFSFHVLLEKAEKEDLLAEGDTAAPWREARYDGMRFLLVEDNEINQEIALSVLTELGAETDVAGNGEEGVTAFMNKEYDVIFMDVRMPVMDGLQATRLIRASGKHDAGTVPIIAMTANAMQEDRESTREAGMDGHVAKPLDMDELKRAVYELLPRRG